MKTFAELMVEAEGFQGKFTPDFDTKKQAIEVGKKVNPKPKPALRPASKATDIVRTKQGGTGKEAIGVPKKKGVGVPQSRPQERGTGTKTYDRVRPKGGPITRTREPEPPKPNKPKKENAFGKGFNRNMGPLSTNKQTRDASWAKAGGSLARGIRNAPGNVVKGAMKAKTTTDGQPESSSGSISAAKRGVYNG